jgi:hypothetical protein
MHSHYLDGTGQCEAVFWWIAIHNSRWRPENATVVSVCATHSLNSTTSILCFRRMLVSRCQTHRIRPLLQYCTIGIKLVAFGTGPRPGRINLVGSWSKAGPITTAWSSKRLVWWLRQILSILAKKIRLVPLNGRMMKSICVLPIEKAVQLPGRWCSIPCTELGT